MKLMHRSLGAIALLAWFGAASAQTINIAPATANTTGGATAPSPIAVSFAPAASAPGNTIAAFSSRITYTAAEFTAVTVAGVGLGSCSNPSPGIINVTAGTNDNSPLPAGTYCNITFTVAAGAARSIALAHVFPPGGGCVDGVPATVACTANPGTITVTSGPSAPTVSPLAALTLPAGPINLTATGSVPVSVATAGVTGGSLALACSIPATGASAFAVTTGGAQTFTAPATVGPATPIGVTCVRGAADVTATLTCTQTATPGPNPANLTAAITCPAGSTAPNPGSVPAAPGPVALVGAPGATATGSISFTNAGGTLAYTVTGCTPSAGYTTATTFPVNVPIGGAGSVGVSCTAPTAAGTSGPTGTLACTTSAAGFNPTFNLTCTSQSASIPTLGYGGKALMVLLMLGFGLVGFQLYRRSA